MKFVEIARYNRDESLLNMAISEDNDFKNFAKLIEEWDICVKLPTDQVEKEYHVFCFEQLGLSLLQMRVPTHEAIFDKSYPR